MSKRLTIVESNRVDPYYNLALEGWLLDHVGEGEVILYLWQNQHTVVIGKNQNAWKECQITTLEKDGGHLARRLSGGGAVYHDLGNVNFTFIAKSDWYDVKKQTAVILRALRELGIQAEATGRNDIHVEGRKVSGNAFYRHAGRCYHHGTLMLDVDMEKMPRYLNVDPDKLKSKGVASVKARVGNLRGFAPTLTVDALKQALCEAFAEEYEGAVERLALDAIDSSDMAARVAQCSDWEWNYGRAFAFDRSVGKRFDWGRVDVALRIDAGHVSAAQVYSDALLPDFIDALPEALQGVRYAPQALAEAVQSMPAAAVGWLGPKQDVSAWLLTIEC